MNELKFNLSPTNNNALLNLCGVADENIQLIENNLDVVINNIGFNWTLKSYNNNLIEIKNLINDMYKTATKKQLKLSDIHLLTREIDMHKDDKNDKNNKNSEYNNKQVTIKTSKKQIIARGVNQREYIRAIQKYDLTFGIGPAGTGKTFLSVAAAVMALENDDIQRIILVRPAVEAGEKLGFLPGDLNQKVDPFLRPIYDALYFFMGYDKVSRLMENKIIEIAPLAFMRGRTLNNSFIIMDEAQNTTTDQMKMFLTRLGFGSKAVVTGDITQIDLPVHMLSGLKHAQKILKNIKECKFIDFDYNDIVRHPLVKKIVAVYESENND